MKFSFIKYETRGITQKLLKLEPLTGSNSQILILVILTVLKTNETENDITCYMAFIIIIIIAVEYFVEFKSFPFKLCHRNVTESVEAANVDRNDLEACYTADCIYFILRINLIIWSLILYLLLTVVRIAERDLSLLKMIGVISFKNSKFI